MRDYYEQLWERLPEQLGPPDWELRRSFLIENVRPGDQALDLGSGVGDFTAVLSDAGAQAVGADVPEAALERDVRRTIATSRVWNAAWAADSTEDPPTPSFLTDAELQVYVDAFTRTGFRGGLNYYRNLDRNWERTATVAERRIPQPALFLTGERDPVRHFMPAEAMNGWVTDLRVNAVIPHAGHWLQQQAPKAVTSYLLTWLAEVES